MKHNESTGLALGCSHTAGVALDPEDCYVSVLGRMLNCTITNKGVPAGNAVHVQKFLLQAIESQRPPSFVIAQWPNPVRKTIWHNGTACNETIKNASPAFLQLLHAGEQNFLQPWVDTVIVCNLLCKMAAIPIINIMIQDIGSEWHSVLNEHDIRLHVDRKTPNETWLMDSGASDNLHHSAQCHKQWAERIFGLLNELTT